MSENKKALITGASSGIGQDIAKELNRLGYDIVIVARNEEKSEKLKASLNGNIEVIIMDLSDERNCIELYNKVGSLDILINNAGFGIFGEFHKTDLNEELKLINTNIVAVHILTKLFLKDMIEKDQGYILNVASIAGYLPGPLMSSYYASKSYVISLTNSIRAELVKNKSNVKISTLSPGPVKTNFNSVAGVKFSLNSLESEYVAKYTIKKLLKGKKDIVPGFTIKALKLISRVLSSSFISKFVYNNQLKKQSRK